MKPKLVCILGLSGSGKTTIETNLSSMCGFRKVTSCATRSIREDEIDGVDYHFISEEKFDEEYKSNKYVEIGGKYGGRYAVRYNEIKPDYINVLVTAKDGLDELYYSNLYDIIAIWIDCDIEERFKRISDRDTIRYALERIEKDGFRRNEEIQTCQHVINTTKMSYKQMIENTINILVSSNWYYNGGLDFE